MSDQSSNLSDPAHVPLKGTRAMILAAGLGRRLKPWTDNHPKALAMVNGKSLLQRNVEWLVRNGITDIIVNVHHFADQVTDAIAASQGWGANISISDETSALLETGGGLLHAAGFFMGGPFLLLNVDILSDLDLVAMMRAHLQWNPLATLAVTKRRSSRFFLFRENGNLCGWRNASTKEELGPVLDLGPESRINLKALAFSGIHIIEPSLLSLISQRGKFSMVDVYLSLCERSTIKAFDHSGSKLVDVGRPESLVEAEKMFA